MNKTVKSIFAVCALAGLTACAQLGTMATGSGLGAPGASAEPAQGDPAAAPGGEATHGSSTPSETKPSESKPAETKPAAPATVSVSIRSACAKTAKVFYGDKPKFGSGTSSTVSSNSVSNKTFRPGDMMWVVDEKDEGLASVKLDDKMKEIEIGSDCKSIKAK